jgi:hypothetical protein
MPNYRLAARRAAAKWHIDPRIFQAMIQQESGFQPGVSSSAGAQGIAQFIPATAAAYGVNLHDGRVTDDLEGAAHYIHDNLEKTGGNYHKALSIYNSGRPDAFRDPGFAGGQTFNYVKNILAMAKGQPGGAADAPPPAVVGGGGTHTVTSTTHTFDKAGYEKARKLAILGNYLAQRDPTSPLLKLGVATTGALPDEAGFRHTSTKTRAVRNSGSAKPVKGSSRSEEGVAKFEGVEVPAWMIPALEYAREQDNHWKITSGVRTRAQQAALYANRANNPNPVAKPGTSNHEIDSGGGGAIDVSNPDALARALAGFRGRKPRRDPSIHDPVHFSLTGR